MKYIKQLSKEQLEELLKFMSFGEFKEIVEIEKIENWENDRYNYISVSIISEAEDNIPENEEGIIVCEDDFDLYDYDFKVYGFQMDDDRETLIEYRRKMLEWFGDKYAKDYLLDLGGENR
jgi:hypothetical protein